MDRVQTRSSRRPDTIYEGYRHMIAIQTKYLAATDSKPSRIKAWTSSGFSATISYPHEFSHELCHFEAVKALVSKHSLPWDLTDMRYGGTEKGYVFCFANAIVVDWASRNRRSSSFVNKMLANLL